MHLGTQGQLSPAFQVLHAPVRRYLIVQGDTYHKLDALPDTHGVSLGNLHA